MNILIGGIKMRFLKYCWRRFITWFENLFKKTQKEQDLDAPAPLKEDLDAPVPANNNIKNNLEENNMGLLQSKVIKFLGGTPAPTSEDECKQQIKELEKKKLKFQNKEGVAPIKPVGQEKLLSSNISPISMRSNNDNSNWIDPNDLNNTFEYPNVDKKALNAIGTKIKQNVKQEIKNQLAESKIQEQLNNHEEKINKNTEDIKKNTEDIKKIQEEQIDIKKMLAELKEMRKEDKKRYEEDKKKSEENQKAHDEIMAMLWNKLDEWNGIKEPTREGSDNRESTNTSLSSFKYKNPFRNNKRQPKMERADMAHSYDENE